MCREFEIDFVIKRLNMSLCFTRFLLGKECHYNVYNGVHNDICSRTIYFSCTNVSTSVIYYDL